MAKPCLEFGSAGEKDAKVGLLSVSDHEITTGTSFPGAVKGLLLELKSEVVRYSDGDDDDDFLAKDVDAALSLKSSAGVDESLLLFVVIIEACCVC